MTRPLLRRFAPLLLLSVVLLAPLAVPAQAAPARVAPAQPAGEARWGWPVGPPVAVVEPYRAPPTPYAPGHRGIDLAASSGTPVLAPASGTVSFSGPVAGRPLVAIDHGDGYVSAIEPVSGLVEVGAVVEPGARLGQVALGGHCDGRCVHFGVRLHGEYVSPMLLLDSVPRAVLLPLG